MKEVIAETVLAGNYWLSFVDYYAAFFFIFYQGFNFFSPFGEGGFMLEFLSREEMVSTDNVLRSKGSCLGGMTILTLFCIIAICFLELFWLNIDSSTFVDSYKANFLPYASLSFIITSSDFTLVNVGRGISIT